MKKNFDRSRPSVVDLKQIKLYFETEGFVVQEISSNWHPFHCVTISRHLIEAPTQIFCGQGLNLGDAYVSAYMEGIERISAIEYQGDTILACYEEIYEHGALDPSLLQAPMVTEFNRKTIIEWVSGINVRSRQKIYVPLNAVVCPYTPSNRATALFYTSSNGLATGSSIQDAICYGLFEVLERDAQSLEFSRTWLKNEIRRLNGVDYLQDTNIKKDGYEVIANESLPIEERNLIKCFEKKGFEVSFRVLQPSCIPVVECKISDRLDQKKVVWGMGCHSEKVMAVLKALSEAAQSHLLYTKGLIRQSDLLRISPEPKNVKEVDFESIISKMDGTIEDELNYTISLTSNIGLEDIYMVNLTSTIFEIPVVRVIVPLAETWVMFNLHTGRGKLGPRAISLI